MILTMMVWQRLQQYRDQCVFYGAMAITFMLMVV